MNTNEHEEFVSIRGERKIPRGAFLLLVIGLASLIPYLAALSLGDLRLNTYGFEVAYVGAFALYLAACALVVRRENAPRTPRFTLLLILVFAVAYRLLLLPLRPTLSDDAYRYVWDGKVQAHGLSPYRHPPNAPALMALRAPGPAMRESIWRYINRKPFITVYPPGAQMAFAASWRLVGDSLTGFKALFSLLELMAALPLLWLLRHFRLPLERSLIYLWSPLLIFEVAHAGHVDALMLPLLVAALWARVQERPWLLGLFLGAATLTKLFPALLLPALLPLPARWSLAGFKPAARVLAAFAAVLGLGYLPYLLWGAGAVGFLPLYFGENFNLGLARAVFDLADWAGLPRAPLANIVNFGGLAVMSLFFCMRPAATGREALVRCVWLIGWFTLTTQNLFPWYLLWLLPLIALLLEPGRFFGFKLAPMTAWLVFTGTAALAYTFFAQWRVVPGAQAAEYGPLYLLLLASALNAMRGGNLTAARLVRTQAMSEQH